MDDSTSWIDRLLDAGISLIIPIGDGELVIGERPGIPYPVAIAVLLIIVIIVARR